MADPGASTAVSDPGKLARLRIIASARRFRQKELVESVDQLGVLAKVDEESGLSARFVFMTLMSAGIAILGMLLSSPAVVIGAMLLSPLMGPIIGAGFALAVGDARELRRCGRTMLIGTLLAIGFSALIVLFSPIQTVTGEIAARTRPNLFDLLVALFSALAGAYAMIRGREGTIVGVAIATALMPPLAVIGFGLATANWTVFGGSLLLFITNLMTIALAAAVMARFYGFSTSLTKKQTRIQVFGIVAAFAVLAIPLGVSLKRIAWESNASRQASAIIKRTFDPKARVTQVEFDFGAKPVSVSSSVLTPRFEPRAEADVARRLSEALGHSVTVKINQYRVGTDVGAAESAELAAARDKAQAEARERQVAELAESLALVAGVSPDQVLIDRDHHRALVRAHAIEGATLAAYRGLESRVASTAPGWSIELRPPARPLPVVRFDDRGEPDPEAIALIAWASKRVATPIELVGSKQAIGKVRSALAKQGATDVAVTETGGSDVRPRWSAADLTER